MGFITEQGLRALEGYKYKSGGYSALDNILNPFWEACVSFVPKWVAPNLLTLIGALLMVSSFAVMLPFDFGLSKNVPSWCFFVAALFQFAYQTLDAIDGKHARNTKTSSPLGQLFDHSLDAFSTTFLALTLCQALRLGDSLNTILLSFAIQVGFFACTWNEMHTETLHTHIGNFGVTESELLIIAILLFTGAFGQDTIGYPLAKTPIGPYLPSFAQGLRFYEPFLYLFFVCSILTVLYLAADSIKHTHNRVKAISQFLPVVLLFIGGLIWRETALFHKYPGLLMLAGGVIFSLVIAKMIICALTKMDFPAVQLETFYVVLAGIVFRVIEPFCPVAVRDLAFFGFVISAFAIHLLFAHGVITQITNRLGIYCFTVGRRPAEVPSKKRE